MAGTINKVILVGNLGRDPEVRTFQDGNKIANLSVATSEQWTDKQSGDRRERTEWHRVVVRNDQLVGVAERFLRKGSKVYLEGQIQTRKFTDQSGQERYMTEVVVPKFRGELQILDGRGGPQGGEGGGTGGGYGGGGQPQGGGGGGVGGMDPRQPAPGPGGGDDMEDDIPF
jgi:single-strand DNA-binding protein